MSRLGILRYTNGMSKLIKLTDEVYLLLRQRADEGHRSLAGQVSYLLAGGEERTINPLKDEIKPITSAFKVCKQHDVEVSICAMMKHKR